MISESKIQCAKDVKNNYSLKAETVTDFDVNIQNKHILPLQMPTKKNRHLDENGQVVYVDREDLEESTEVMKNEIVEASSKSSQIDANACLGTEMKEHCLQSNETGDWEKLPPGVKLKKLLKRGQLLSRNEKKTILPADLLRDVTKKVRELNSDTLTPVGRPFKGFDGESDRTVMDEDSSIVFVSHGQSIVAVSNDQGTRDATYNERKDDSVETDSDNHIAMEMVTQFRSVKETVKVERKPNLSNYMDKTFVKNESVKTEAVRDKVAKSAVKTCKSQRPVKKSRSMCPIDSEEEIEKGDEYSLAFKTSVKTDSNREGRICISNQTDTGKCNDISVKDILQINVTEDPGFRRKIKEIDKVYDLSLLCTGKLSSR